MSSSAATHASLGLVLAMLASTAAFASVRAVIRIDSDARGPAVSSRMYGVFLEEINHGIDGGLYGELIRNRAFEDARPPEGYVLRGGHWVDAQGFDAGYDEFGYAESELPFWALIQRGRGQGAMRLERTGGVSAASSYCLRLTVDRVADGSVGVANEGFFGIGVARGQRYELSLYARGAGTFTGPLEARLEDEAGVACSDALVLDGIGPQWARLGGTLRGARDVARARLVVTAGAPGVVWLDFVSLFPGRTWRGRPRGLRADIAQMIADLEPGFVRFPGGCVVEGGTIETAYDWKLTVGPPEERTERWGPWHYRRTHGMGLFEYLQFCEDLGAEPLWVGFAGQTCIYREREHVPMSQMDRVRQDFLDYLAYANGPADSTWGRRRAAAGHPAPFGVKYVEIGNENAGEEYEERYRYIHTALKAHHPDITYLADLSYHRMPDPLYDVGDLHYYRSPFWFLTSFERYDDRDRSLPPLYLGEVAVTSGEAGPLRGNLRAALAEGVFLMGCERNADVVRMVSYAPLLAHVDGRTWDWHAMIYHDNTRVFGTVSYYLWKLFAANRPAHILKTTAAIPEPRAPDVAGGIGVGTWQTAAEFKDIRVTRDGQVIYAADLAAGDPGWKSDGGQWSVAGGAFRQGVPDTALALYGDESWSNYTLSIKARKLSGAEGFLVVFGVQARDKYWWNVGGWGNRQHALQYNQEVLGDRRPGSIETGRWYDLRVELKGRRVRCFLDGNLVQEQTVPVARGLYAIAGRMEGSRDTVLKVINVGDEEITARIEVAGAPEPARSVRVTTLTASDPEANNSLEEPFRVVPRAVSLPVRGGELVHRFPATSLTVLRLEATE